MLIRKQDLSVLLMYYLGYSKIRNLVFRLQHKPITRFVTFHDLPLEALGSFEANLLFLKKNTNVVSIGNFLSGRLSTGKINVVITFDDGYKSWVTDALPILKKLELPAIFFVSSGFVGLSKEDEANFMRTQLLLTQDPRNATHGLTFEDLKRIVAEGFTVGGHTSSHCNLAEIINSTQLKYEIGYDKAKLESMTGKKIKYFAYPSGAYQNPELDLTKVLKEFGYKAAVTTVSGFNGASTSPYLLHRELTGASMNGTVFKARVYGNYDPVRFLLQQVNKLRLWASKDKNCS
jgi:peptidoglycan/xylan/chitin deacetylase (PgdA/CDA1 family)